ncbi:septal ring lytic transglycosylase RlpA family protein [Parabacteroides sp. Marseille-P3160]|uniref:septal ring lytic transglycosylase RlpA family protein n=1 Tax=Parabacteroides sp. Marseille-P3160 TaxID=1917887 RepID=UPI0009B9F261|nr:septal ring lytic transglycosylase RlpA family protein [Parabacteroides sp. Marseille-P3160]
MNLLASYNLRWRFLLLVFFAVLTFSDNAFSQEEGLASYYHARFHGRMTASGEVHDKDELTAAHRTCPFGSYLRVTNLSNMKSVIVCVTDRGPRLKKRVVDVSECAAETLGFIRHGIARVRVEPVCGPVDLRWLRLLVPQRIFFDTEALRENAPLHLPGLREESFDRLTLF